MENNTPATTKFKLYLNSILNIIPDDIHNKLWDHLIDCIREKPIEHTPSVPTDEEIGVIAKEWFENNRKFFIPTDRDLSEFKSIYKLTLRTNFSSEKKNLKDITDEDCMACLKIMLGEDGWEANSEKLKKDWIATLKIELNEGGYGKWIIKPYFKHVLFVYQYLESRGYKLPKQQQQTAK